MTSPRVNNDLYRIKGHCWWDDDVGEFSTIRFFINPIRVGYFEHVLRNERARGLGRTKILDVGCGGGVLAEPLARAGFQVTGVDPAAETIETARAHASASGLSIEYVVGAGEHLPFADSSFDHVVCCDVLEHVDDVDRVIGEIARVLRPGGLLLYDTVNRTFLSKVVLIKIMQEWPSTAFAAPNSHVWDQFIKPEELVATLERHGLDHRQMRGITTRRNPIAAFMDFRRRARGEITFEELGRRLAFHESGHLNVSYMGFAAKPLRDL